jgi:hypothetical protein
MTQATVHLGAEARAYALQVLGWGRTLSHLLAERFGGEDAVPGRIFAQLPPTAPPWALAEFRSGGLFTGEESSPLWRQGQFLHETILTFLREEPDGLCVVQDYLPRPSDAAMQHAAGRWTAYQEEVYQLLLPGDTSREIEQTFAEAFSSPIFCGVLSRAGVREEDREGLTLERLEQIADAAAMLFVVAYDGESFLFWER